MANTMRRWQLEAYGRAHLRLADVPVPVPGRSEVLVKVAAVSLNYRDKLMIDTGMGLPNPMPMTPASDMAGEVVAVGADVTRWRPGDKVTSTFWDGWIDGVRPSDAVTSGGPGAGMLADYVALDARALVDAPASLTPEQASTLPCAGLTAWYALTEAAPTRPGQSVLIHGTGGVALFAVQFARAQGARVIVVSGSGSKLARVRSLGADHAVPRDVDGGWEAAVHALTGGRGVDHVLELAGGDNFGRSLSVLAQGGRVSVIGVLNGETLSTSAYPVILNRAMIEGIGVGHRRAHEAMVRAIDFLGIEPVIEQTYPLAELPAALDHLARGAFGKIVVRS